MFLGKMEILKTNLKYLRNEKCSISQTFRCIYLAHFLYFRLQFELSQIPLHPTTCKSYQKYITVHLACTWWPLYLFSSTISSLSNLYSYQQHTQCTQGTRGTWCIVLWLFMVWQQLEKSKSVIFTHVGSLSDTVWITKHNEGWWMVYQK